VGGHGRDRRENIPATSRHGAPQALARKLLVAGIPGQQPVEVFSQVCTYDNGTEIHTEELRGCVTYRSLYAMARTTLEEGDRPLHRARYKERPQIAFPSQPGEPETRFTPPDDIVVLPEPDTHRNGATAMRFMRSRFPARPSLVDLLFAGLQVARSSPRPPRREPKNHGGF
jgi:hypothetical protein